MARRHYPSETNGRAGRTSVDITADIAGWRYSGLRILNLAADTTHEFATGTTEVAVLPLSGSLTVEVESDSFRLDGREGVFSAVTDFAYVPIDASVKITTHGPVQVALCTAEATAAARSRAGTGRSSLLSEASRSWSSLRAVCEQRRVRTVDDRACQGRPVPARDRAAAVEGRLVHMH